MYDVMIANNIAENAGGTEGYCNGGGMYILNSSIFASSCIFDKNTSDAFGGAAYFGGPELAGGSQLFVNCLMINNNAEIEGGGHPSRMPVG